MASTMTLTQYSNLLNILFNGLILQIQTYKKALAVIRRSQFVIFWTEFQKLVRSFYSKIHMCFNLSSVIDFQLNSIQTQFIDELINDDCSELNLLKFKPWPLPPPSAEAKRFIHPFLSMKKLKYFFLWKNQKRKKSTPQSKRTQTNSIIVFHKLVMWFHCTKWLDSSGVREKRCITWRPHNDYCWANTAQLAAGSSFFPTFR